MNLEALKQRTAYKKQWAAAHRDDQNAKNRDRYHANKVRYRANQRRYEAKIVEISRTNKIWLAKHLVKLARHRAKVRCLPFSITYEDIPIPDNCPVLGIPLFRNARVMTQNSPTVDRIEPSRGYVPGNVIVISLKANLIKTNATADEILKVGLFFKMLDEH